MTEKELRVELRRAVPAPNFKKIWLHLKQEGRVGRVLNGTYLFEDLKADAEELARYQRSELENSEGEQSIEGDFDVSRHPPLEFGNAACTDYEKEYTSYLSWTIAKEAAASQEVGRFRNDVLEDDLLTYEQARDLLSSTAAALFSIEELRERGVPLRKHTAVVIDDTSWREGDWRHRRTTVSVDPPGVTLSKERRYKTPGVRYLHYMTEDGFVESARVLQGSLLDELRRVSESLVLRYPHWQEAQATRFVLSGWYPELSPVIGEIDYEKKTLVLRVRAYVSGETVGRCHRQLRRAVWVGDTHLKTAKGIAVWLFVEGQRDSEGKLPLWPELLRRWNAAHPKERYSDKSGLRKIYRRARREIATL